MVLALTVVRDWQPILPVLALGICLALLEQSVTRSRGAVLSLVSVALLLPWSFRHEDALVAIGPLTITEAGLRFAGIFVLKMVSLFLLMSALLASAPLSAHAMAAGRLGVPSLFTQLLTLSWRYVFLLKEEWSRLRMALRVRGFRSRMDNHSRRTMGNALGTILVRGHDRADRVAHAMRTRGFDGRFRSLGAPPAKLADVAMVSIGMGLGIGVIGWDAIR